MPNISIKNEKTKKYWSKFLNGNDNFYKLSRDDSRDYRCDNLKIRQILSIFSESY